MRCEDVIEDKIAVLYGEADEDAQRRVAAHSATCAACRDEQRELAAVRRALPAWRLPEGLRPRRPWRRTPLWSRWGLAAAATLLVGVAGWALPGVRVSRSAGQWSLHFGSGVEPADWELRLSEMQARHEARLRAAHDEIAGLRATLLQARTAAPATPDQQVVLAQVRQLLRESEERQRLALRAGLQVVEERRQYDMARIRTGFSYLEGRNGRDVANTMKLVSYMLASQPGGATTEPR